MSLIDYSSDRLACAFEIPFLIITGKNRSRFDFRIPPLNYNVAYRFAISCLNYNNTVNYKKVSQDCCCFNPPFVSIRSSFQSASLLFSIYLISILQVIFSFSFVNRFLLQSIQPLNFGFI